MKKPRLLGWQKLNVYHVISRTTGQDFLLGPAERQVFGQMLTKMCRFCGVELLTWCCLSNHFHLLVRLSEDRSIRLKDQLRGDRNALLKHLSILYSGPETREIATELQILESAGQSDAASTIVERYLERIGKLSTFVKELKQRYSIFFNHRHDRSGTLWDSRFRSVLVENSPEALRTVATYIDLNPVRAGLATDPADYRWCGYGQATGGNKSARFGLQAVISERGRGESPDIEPVQLEATAGSPCQQTWKQIAEQYRCLLFGSGVELTDQGGEVIRKGPSPAEVHDVLSTGGKLPAHTLFRKKVLHLTRGTALGSTEFLRELLSQRPDQVSLHRTTAARPIRSLQSIDFQSLREIGK